MTSNPVSASLPDLERAATSIVAARLKVPEGRAALVAISGIDGSGKGFVTERLARAVERWGLSVTTLCADAWIEPAHAVFGGADPGEFFHRSAARIETMLAGQALPLWDRRLAVGQTDVVLLEGIFLLKREMRPIYDLTIWVDCSFETALERAIARRQEGLAPAETKRAYRSIYFPAQARHIVRDDPMRAAGIVIGNDARRGARGPHRPAHSSQQSASPISPSIAR